MLFKNYSKLPDIIPIHYNAAGEVDNSGNKISIFILPIIATVIFFTFIYLSKIPHIFNYIVEINMENAENQYTIATKMLRHLKLGITCVFFLISYKTIQIVDGKTDLLGKYFLMFTLVIIFGINRLFYSLRKTVKFTFEFVISLNKKKCTKISKTNYYQCTAIFHV